MQQYITASPLTALLIRLNLFCPYVTRHVVANVAINKPPA
jgi:hypothetical protein